MRRRDFITLVGGAAAAAWPTVGSAQTAGSRPLVAVILGGSSSAGAIFLNSLAQGPRELGYVEGRNLNIVSRYAEGDLTRMPALAEDLVRLEPKVFVTSTTTGTLAIKRATASIPIVNAALTDPVALGWAASESRPRGQVTGILLTLDSLSGKQLDLLLNLMPGISRIGVMVNANNPTSVGHMREAELAAPSLGISLLPVEVRSPRDIDAAFGTFVRLRAQAVMLFPDPMILGERKRIAALVAAEHLPAMYSFRECVEEGGLMSYGVNLRESWRRAAAYVDKILKGANPGELPLEFPTRLELLINLTAAKALGLKVPPTLLVQADELIE
jgi:putative tryptophan/tyrosine transport system substrate-binding protein